MNTEVYKFLLHTYGKRPGFWVGVTSEIVRSLMVRAWVVIIMARATVNLAEQHLAAAKNDVLLFLLVYT